MKIIVENIVLPNKPLTNFELEEAAHELNISNFRGVFLRNTLPKRPKKNECGILNLDDTSGNGTHWVAWYKNGKIKYYFDWLGPGLYSPRHRQYLVIIDVKFRVYDVLLL